MEHATAPAEPIGDATYSPEDNKLRLYAYERLPGEVWARLKAAGFQWAPKQQLFVAPMWTPSRYDILVELCGEVGDEATTMEERARFRAERFERYRQNRERDAYAAAERVQQLTGDASDPGSVTIAHNDPTKADRIARKVNRAMAEAVDQWSRREYWTSRIPAVIAHADYKGQQAVRHRRIKGLEADERKHAKSIDSAARFIELWSQDPMPSARAWQIANHDRTGSYDVLREKGEREYMQEVPAEVIDKARAHATAALEREIAWHTRWLDHARLRLAYERELMEQDGGDVRERHDYQPGGTITGARWGHGEALTILKVNKAGGRVNSLTTTTPQRDRQWKGSQMIVPIEEVKTYTPPQEGVEAPKAARRKPLPMVNHPCAESLSMTEAEYKAHPEGARSIRDQRPSRYSQATHRRRGLFIDYGYMGNWKPVYLTDRKRIDPPGTEPTPPPPPPPAPEPIEEREEVTLAEVMENVGEQHSAPAPAPKVAPSLFDTFEETLKGGGVKTVIAEQLYPTPPDVARRMVELAGVEAGECVLEPSAGTGNIVQAVIDAVDTEVKAYEVNPKLCTELSRKFPSYKLHVDCEDFLTVTRYQGQYPVVLMNPPFNGGVDIKHIRHAMTFLKPGGRLVAICANGPRQQAAFRDIADHWEELPEGTFKGSGTMVRTALFTYTKTDNH